MAKRKVVNRVFAITATRSEVTMTSDAPFGIAVMNTGTNTVYIGDENVTSANGFPVLAGITISYDNISSRLNTMYAVCAASQTSELRVLEIGV